MGNHTPAPWAVGKAFKETYGLANCRAIDSEHGKIAIVKQDIGCTSLEEVEANARLIAAAPELLDSARELLEAWRCAYEEPAGCTCPKCKAKAVIAKATKET